MHIRRQALSFVAVFSVALAFLLVQPLPVAACAPAQSASLPWSGPLLDLNTATPAQLLALPGMGQAYVRRIVAGRPYTAKNQLVTRGVLPAAAYAQIKDRIVAHRLTAKRKPDV